MSGRSPHIDQKRDSILIDVAEVDRDHVPMTDHIKRRDTERAVLLIGFPRRAVPADEQLRSALEIATIW